MSLASKLLDGGWVICPECGNRDVDFAEDAPAYTAIIECKDCGERVKVRVQY